MEWNCEIRKGGTIFGPICLSDYSMDLCIHKVKILNTCVHVKCIHGSALACVCT